MRHAVAFGVDPLLRHLLLGVCHLGERQELGLAGVATVDRAALKGDHLIGDARDGILHRRTARHDGLLNVGLARKVRAAALEQGKLDAADLRAGLLLHNVGKTCGKAAELGVTEAVGCAGLGLGNKAAVGIVDALGDRDHAVALFLVDALDVSKEFIHIEVTLGQVDEVGARAVFGGERGGGGQPAGVAAHDLDDADHTGVVHARVLIDLHAARGDILRGAGVAGAVVGAEEIVVDGLGNAHHAALIADLLHILGDLVAGVHRVVAAVVEEIADIMLLEHLENTLIIGVVHIGIGDLVAAGAERGGGGVLQQLQLARVLLAHVEQAVGKHALDAVLRAVDGGDAVGVKRRADHAVGAGVDDRGRAAGLTDDAGAFQFTHIVSPLTV